jgi:hypothetical protein
MCAPLSCPLPNPCCIVGMKPPPHVPKTISPLPLLSHTSRPSCACTHHPALLESCPPPPSCCTTSNLRRQCECNSIGRPSSDRRCEGYSPVGQAAALHVNPAKLGHQKSACCTHTSEDGVKSARHRGHSGFWLHQSAMHCQQKTCPQGVAVGWVRVDRHSGHFLLPAPSLPASPAAAAAAAAACRPPLPVASAPTSGRGLPSAASSTACRCRLVADCCPGAAPAPPASSGMLPYRRSSHRVPEMPSCPNSSRPKMR